jgi:integrase
MEQTGRDSHLISEGAKRALLQLAPIVRERGSTLEATITELRSALGILERLRDPNSKKVPGLLECLEAHCESTLPTLGTKPAREEMESWWDEQLKRASGGTVQKDYAKELKTRTERFHGSKIASRPLGFFGTKQGEEALRRWMDTLEVGPTTWNNYRRHLSMFFNWAVHKGKLKVNPCAQIEEHRKTRDQESEIGIISPGQLRTLLLLCQGEPKEAVMDKRWRDYLLEMLPAVALQAFCGVRSREVCRLKWEDLDSSVGLLTVSSAKSKTRKGRIIPLSPALLEWISPFLGRSGLIAPAQYHRKMSELRKIMRKPPEKKNGALLFPPCEMPDNCLRHSFGTYHLNLSKNEAETSRLMGNKPEILRAHYEALSKRAVLDAGDWFEVRPSTRVLQIGTERTSGKRTRSAS